MLGNTSPSRTYVAACVSYKKPEITQFIKFLLPETFGDEELSNETLTAASYFRKVVDPVADIVGVFTAEDFAKVIDLTQRYGD